MASVGRLMPSCAHQPGSLLLIHRQFAGSDVQHQAGEPPAVERQGRCLAGSHGHLGGPWQIADELGEDIQTALVPQMVCVVEDQQERSWSVCQRHQQAPDDGPVRHRARCDGAEDGRLEWLDAVDGGGEVGKERGRVVVEVIHRQPGRRARNRSDAQLGEDTGLAVASWSDDGHERAPATGPELTQQLGPRHPAVQLPRHEQLGFDEVLPWRG